MHETLDHPVDRLLRLLARRRALLVEVGHLEPVQGLRDPEKQRVVEDTREEHGPRLQHRPDLAEHKHRVDIRGVVGEDERSLQPANAVEPNDLEAITQGEEEPEDEDEGLLDHVRHAAADFSY